ncbi:hypothetical protein ACWF95_34065 [Streptomyces vinaceus]
MTETSAAAPADTPLRLSPADEARVGLAHNLLFLASEAFDRVPVQPDVAPGDLLRQALDLQRRVAALVNDAVVAERERGTTWDQIGAAAGITRQTAHERWSGDIRAWAAVGRSAIPKDSTERTLDRATFLDAMYRRGLTGERSDAVSAGLDALRFPGSAAYEYARRAPGAALHTRVRELLAQAEELREPYERLRAEGRQQEYAANVLAEGALHTELSGVYDQLVTAEPALAEEHRAQADLHRGYAVQCSKNAEVFAREPE